MSAPGLPPTVSRHRRSVVASVAVAAIVVVLAASCSGADSTTTVTSTSAARSATTDRTSTIDGSELSTADTTTAPSDDQPPASAVPPSTNPAGQSTPAGHQEIIDRYTGYWDARFAANAGTPNPADPSLAEYATGAQLEAVIAETQANLDGGRALQKNSNPVDYRQVSVVSVDGSFAVMQECFVDDGLVIDRDTGEVVNDTVATHSVRGELLRVGDVWRVSSVSLVQRWEGVAGCALAS